MKLPVDYKKLSSCERKIAREEYMKIQNGKCIYCKNDLSLPAHNKILKKYINKKLFPKNFFDWPVHLHHDHNTGMTIGAVHCHCNAVLWQYHGE